MRGRETVAREFCAAKCVQLFCSSTSYSVRSDHVARDARLPGRAIPRPRAPLADATIVPEITHPASSGALTESKLILAENQGERN